MKTLTDSCQSVFFYQIVFISGCMSSQRADMTKPAAHRNRSTDDPHICSTVPARTDASGISAWERMLIMPFTILPI